MSTSSPTPAPPKILSIPQGDFLLAFGLGAGVVLGLCGLLLPKICGYRCCNSLENKCCPCLIHYGEPSYADSVANTLIAGEVEHLSLFI
jgi:hypothetical protein